MKLEDMPKGLRPSSWRASDVEAWPLIVAAIGEVYATWPRELVLEDLRWWADRVHMKREKQPGRPKLSTRWGWSDRKVRSLLQEVDPFGKCPADVQPASSPCPADVQRTSSSSTVEGEESAENVQPVSSERPANVQPMSNERPHARSRQRTEDRGQRTEENKGSDDPVQLFEDKTPSWVKAEARKLPGVTPKSLHGTVVKVLNAIRSEDCDPQRCGSEGKQVAKLFAHLAKLDAIDLPTFEEAALLVARAFHDCPDGLFARDVRGEGWEGSTDRQHSVSTFCVQLRWADRLDAARRWSKGTARNDPSMLDHPEDTGLPSHQRRRVTRQQWAEIRHEQRQAEEVEIARRRAERRTR